MMTDTNNTAETNHNFSKIAETANSHGSAGVAENSTPKDSIGPGGKDETIEIVKDEELFAISDKLIKKNRVALEALAKW